MQSAVWNEYPFTSWWWRIGCRRPLKELYRFPHQNRPRLPGWRNDDQLSQDRNDTTSSCRDLTRTTHSGYNLSQTARYFASPCLIFDITVEKSSDEPCVFFILLGNLTVSPHVPRCYCKNYFLCFLAKIWKTIISFVCHSTHWSLLIGWRKLP